MANQGTPSYSSHAASSASGCPVIAITSGEPAGVGPDICLALAQRRFPARLVILGDRELLEERRRRLNVEQVITEFEPDCRQASGELEVLHMPLAQVCRSGILNTANSPYVLSLL